MTQIIGAKRSSKCMYCNAEAYGIGCPYSPHKKHVHCDDPKRCIYCGSTAFGIGCPYNPFGRVHIHGVEFNQMVKESVHRSIVAGLVLSQLVTPIEEMAAYKIGLIDEEGHRVRIPETEEEKQAFTPLDAYILKLRRLLGEDKLSLLSSETSYAVLNKRISEQKFSVERYQEEVRLKSRVANFIQECRDIIIDGIQHGFSASTIENMIIESLLNEP